MKNKILKRAVVSFAFIMMLFGCTDLDVPVKSELTPDIFPQTAEDFFAVAGPVYSNLSSLYFKTYWFLQECSTDAMILTANGGHWYDDGRYANYHYHTWNKDQRFIREGWQWSFSGISTCNRILELYESAEESDVKTQTIAEIRAMRAFYYFLIMDLYGDAPLIAESGQEVTVRDSRADIFNFIESELQAVIPDLTDVSDITTYGRPTKWMAYALLAKSYINAEVYVGQDKYTEALQACDAIISEAQTNGTFDLSDDYLAEFNYDNGPQIKDFIFAIPYDVYNIQNNYPARYWLNPALRAKYELNYNPSSCLKAMPAYYDLFTDATDERQQIWLTGKQYDFNGSAVIIQTTNIGLDNRYDGSYPDSVVSYHLEFTKEIEFRDLEKFDTGDDQLGKAVGYRCNKFYPDADGQTRDQSNDWPVFRYADILLMKAEAILRGASTTMGQTSLELVNMVRARSNATLFDDINLETLLEERARELCYESWRRNDLIRFGKFEDQWGWKTDNDVNKRLFPVPTEEMQLNPGFVQNPGYPD